MNELYGMQIFKSMESDDNRYAVNAFGGRQMLVAGLLTGVIAIATLIFHQHVNPSLIVPLSLAPILIVLVPCCTTYLFAKRLL